MSYADKVRAGVALLDEKAPGWHEKIDLDSLEMYCTQQCIMGQLTGDYYSEESYDIRGKTSGFELGLDGEYETMPTLHRLWSYVVRTRQEMTA